MSSNVAVVRYGSRIVQSLWIWQTSRQESDTKILIHDILASILHQIRWQYALPLSAWWRHQMKTFSALMALCEGNAPVIGEFPSQRSLTRSFSAFLWCTPEQTAEQTDGTPVIWDAIALIMMSLHGDTSAVNATFSTLSPAVQSSPNTPLPFIDRVRQLSSSFQCIVSDSTEVTFAQFYYGGIMNIKWTVSCFGNGNVKVHAHGTEICRNHELLDGLPEQFVDVQQVCDLMSELASYDVCVGNTDVDLICLAEPMLNVEHSGYHKENWQAVAGNLSYNAEVRGSKCPKFF